MDLGLCIRNVGKFTQLSSDQLAEVQSLQDQYTLIAGRKKGDGEADPVLADLGKRLAAAQTRQKLYNDFLNFWKDALKGILEIIKGFNELAFGR